jgi:NitT/TauT family transport system ATP-binding protein
MHDVLEYKRPEDASSSAGKGRIEIENVGITFGKGADAHRAVEATTM